MTFYRLRTVEISNFDGLKSLHYSNVIIKGAKVKGAKTLTVNGICLSRQHNGILGSGGMETPPPKISGTTIGLSMKFLADVGIYNVAQNV